MNKEELYLAEDNLAAEIEEISEFVFNHAELGSEEFKSCNYLVEKLKEHGFTVTCPYLDLDTAFRAELYCGEGPKVAVLPEYDALPGYGPNKDEVAHACGHNWIAASTLGAALTLANSKIRSTERLLSSVPLPKRQPVVNVILPTVAVMMISTLHFSST